MAGDAVLLYLTKTRYPDRNRAIFLLSVRAGLRAKEIASLTWAMLTDAEGNIGDSIHLVDEASKGSSGRVIPLNKELKAALVPIQKGAGRRPSWSRRKEPNRPARRRS
jgi:integrase